MTAYLGPGTTLEIQKADIGRNQMTALQLSIAMHPNARSRAVLDGRIKPEGIDLIATGAHPSEIFWRQLHFSEFDISEMSMSSLLILLANGNRDWVRNDAGVRSPSDLRGKRVGVPEYQQTAALWGRGVLQHEFGVSPAEIDWYMERTEEVSHGGATGFHAPPGVRLNRIPAGESIGSMLVEGKLDAALHYIVDNNLVDRSNIRLEDRSEGRFLFPDRAAEGRRYFAKTGIFPINHAMIIRRTIVERHPWAVLNVFNAFRAAKDQWLAQVLDAAQTHLQLGLLPPEAETALRKDPYPYGVVANRSVLETIAQYSHEQGLTPRTLSLGEVFPPNTLSL
jgi:4,5-dihydroxyphthalate decarboxylase